MKKLLLMTFALIMVFGNQFSNAINQREAKVLQTVLKTVGNTFNGLATKNITDFSKMSASEVLCDILKGIFGDFKVPSVDEEGNTIIEKTWLLKAVVDTYEKELGSAKQILDVIIPVIQSQRAQLFSKISSTCKV